MRVVSLRLTNFRSFRRAEVQFGPGVNVVVGANATGKTNLLEAAWFALRGGSPRTRRDDKLVTWGERALHVALSLEAEDGGRHAVAVGFAPGQGKRARWDGAELGSLEALRSRAQAFIFVPESLLLVKGSPARRRAHLDALGSGLDPVYAATAAEFQAVLRQRNAQLVALRRGADEVALEPWDVQFARLAVALGRCRRALVEDLADRFAATAAELAPGGARFALSLVSHLEALGYDPEALRAELRRRRAAEVARGVTLVGPHRDDLVFLEVAGGSGTLPPATAPVAGDDAAAVATPALPPGGRDLRLFGSQGEQRAAVLALLLAEQRLAAARTGDRGTLFLDDVMSELDDARRRRLMRLLADAGQAILTTTNRHYFTDEELGAATVIELPLPVTAGRWEEPGTATGAAAAQASRAEGDDGAGGRGQA